MPIHQAIITKLANGSNNAVVELSSDVPSAAFNFRVFAPNGGQPQPTPAISVNLNASQFGSSFNSAMPNLFTGSNDQTALVEVDFPPGLSFCVQRMKAGPEKVVCSVPPMSVAKGTLFHVPVGDLGNETTLLIGNPTDSDAVVNVTVGTNPPGADITVLRRHVATVQVTSADTQHTVTSKNNVDIVVALKVTDGKTTMTYMLP